MKANLPPQFLKHTKAKHKNRHFRINIAIDLFNHCSKKIQCKHIKNKVSIIGMDKTGGNKLIITFFDEKQHTDLALVGNKRYGYSNYTYLQ
jgi:hypothetical protein